MWFLRMVVAAVCLLVVLARSGSTADDAALPAESATSADPKAEFSQVFSQWKSIIGELVSLRMKYQMANDEQRIEIQQQWGPLIAQGQQMEDRLIRVAEKAYAAAPAADKSLTEFLINMVAVKVRQDDYEPAARIGKLLLDNQCDNEPLLVQAGVAACAVGDFDAAEQYLRRASEKDASLSVSRESVDSLIRDFLDAPEQFKQAWTREKQIRQNEANADNLPRVLLKTSKGNIELELFENEAPLTVANFIYLVERGFYDGLTFHRVLPGFMAQSGCPKGDGSGGPGYSIPCECYKPGYRTHFRGSLSMAKNRSGGSDGQGRDTGGSQFFISFVPALFLDGRYTAFGHVIQGMDVMAKLQRRDPDDKESPRPDKIIEAKVIRKRAHEYVPKKLAE